MNLYGMNLCQPMSLHHRQVNAEGGAVECGVTGLFGRGGHVNTPVVVLVDDTLGQSESQPPTAFLGGKAGVKNRLVVLARNTFAGIGNADTGQLSVAARGGGEGAYSD